MVALSVLPLTGLAIVVGGRAADTSTLNDDARQIEGSTDKLIALTALQASLVDEQTWTFAALGITSAGLPLDMLKPYGLDVETQQARAIAKVDAGVAKLGSDQANRLLAAIRLPDATLSALDQRYEPLGQEVERLRVGELGNLRSHAAAFGDGVELLRAIQALDAALQVRHSYMLQTAGFYFSRFGGFMPSLFEGPLGGVAQTQKLIRFRDDYWAASESVHANAPAASPLTARLNSIQDGRASKLVESAVNGEILAAIRRGGSIADLTTVSIPEQLSAIGDVMMASAVGAKEHADLVDVAASEITSSTTTLRAGATREARNALMVLIGLVGLSLVVAATGSRLITRPLRQLAVGATAIRDGRSAHRIIPTGPLEVRAAALAINEAAAHLDLAERQARALAVGDLDAKELAETAPGQLGESLQHAVRTLTASLSEREEFRRLLSHEATHDSLTGLPNRNASMRQLSASLARATRSTSSIAVLFIDLDAFKPVNDVHGHQAGDTVLVEIARRLSHALREGDHVGRLGGDEFLVIAEPIQSSKEAIELGRRILNALAGPIEIGESTVSVGACIGIALANDDRLTPDELLRDADLAVYKAKEIGPGNIELCDEELRFRRIEQADLTAALKDAIANDELLLHYQPIISSRTGALQGLEALVRWDRPGQGLVPPDSFIPFAERSDLIVALDRWVIEHVARQLDGWRDDPILGSVPVSINISGRHLSRIAVVHNVCAPLTAHGIDTSRVIIEVTESAVLEELHVVAAKIQRLRDVGIKVAIDDFGTGYTSLAHLRSLPIDILKIDRSFTMGACDDPHARSIVKLIIDIGHLLGARITAEGIETLEQAHQLTSMGADELQGFYYAKPVPADKVAASIVRTLESVSNAR